MAGRKVSPAVKMGLELGPVLAFFVAYMWLRDDVFVVGGTEYSGFIVVTAAFIPLLLICTGILWKLSGKLSRMQVTTAVLVVLFGGMSVWLNDERFFKIKPTIIYLLFAGILTVGLLRGQSWLQYVLEEMMPLRREGWMILTKRLAIFFAGLAIVNEVVWRTMSTDAWVNFKTFGLTLALFAFFMAQGRLMEQYGFERDDKQG